MAKRIDQDLAPALPLEEQSPAASEQSAAPDWLALSNLALPQNYDERLGIKKHLAHVPVRRPSPQEYFRVRPGEAWQRQVCILEDKIERELYVVAPPMWEALGQDAKPRTLLTCITRQQVVFLWPLLPLQTDGRVSAWATTAHEAANLAINAWIRLVANTPMGAYDIFAATGNLTEPDWPEHDFQQLIRIAFRDRVVTGPDHPVVRRLHGEV